MKSYIANFREGGGGGEGQQGFFYMHHLTDRIAHTTAFVIPVVEHWLEREVAQWVHPMKDRSDNPSHHEQTSHSLNKDTNVINHVTVVLLFLLYFVYLLF